MFQIGQVQFASIYDLHTCFNSVPKRYSTTVKIFTSLCFMRRNIIGNIRIILLIVAMSYAKGVMLSSSLSQVYSELGTQKEDILLKIMESVP